MLRTSKESDLSKKKNGVTVHLRELSTFIGTKIPTTTAFVCISFLYFFSLFSFYSFIGTKIPTTTAFVCISFSFSAHHDIAT